MGLSRIEQTMKQEVILGSFVVHCCCLNRESRSFEAQPPSAGLARDLEASTSGPKVDLRMALPNELYWDILTRVFADSVHRVCFPKSYELDLAWELNALSTFFRVSHSFQGITADICQKMYGSPDRGKKSVILYPICAD